MGFIVGGCTCRFCLVGGGELLVFEQQCCGPSCEPVGVWRMNWGESSGETIATAQAGDTDPEPRWRERVGSVRKSIGWAGGF